MIQPFAQPMPGSRTWPSQGWGMRSWSRHDGSRLAETLRAFERTRTADIQLQIRTDEGDTVTLTIHSEQDQTSVTYRARGRDDQGRRTSGLQAFQSTQSSQVDMQVEGSLNAEELADVKELVGRVQRAVQGFFADGGDVSLESLGTGEEGIESLAGFQLDVQRSETVQAVWLRMRQWAGDHRHPGHEHEHYPGQRGHHVVPLPAIQPQAGPLAPAPAGPDNGDAIVEPSPEPAADLID